MLGLSESVALREFPEAPPPAQTLSIPRDFDEAARAVILPSASWIQVVSSAKKMAPKSCGRRFRPFARSARCSSSKN